MATSFDRWAKDPYFSAAEEVQESADRMESVYRQWIYELKGASDPDQIGPSSSGEIRRELHTALGTAKWQLEELERAVTSNDEACSAGKDTRTRHSHLFEAIWSRIMMVENALKETSFEGDSTTSWVRLDEVERDELALFLSCSPPKQEKVMPIPHVGELAVGGKSLEMNVEAAKDSLRKDRRVHGHRRTASAGADMESWKILVPSGDEERPNLPPPKAPSFSCLTKVVESTSKMKWPKNGFRKWKGGDQYHVEESIPLRNQQLTRDIDACYERSKSCLSGCSEETYDKQLYGWLGTLHRQLQRSQYQIQYGRPMQMIFWAILVILLIVLFVFRAV